jgi:hypothetical protein
VSGSAKLFPQHCQVPNLSNTAHLKVLTEELTTTTAIAAKMHKGHTFIHKLKLTADVGSKRRVGTNCIAAPPEMSPVGQPITRITTVPPIMKTRDPTAKIPLALFPEWTKNNIIWTLTQGMALYFWK